MAASPRFEVLRCVRGLFQVGAFAGLSDGQLLDRFVDRNRESAELAFAAMVERHGPMVLRVCRRMLANRHDAEDAFQATFLVLVRRAASVRSRESVASWLHGVALRVCSAARATADRRRVHERKALERSRGGDVPDAVVADEIGPIVHEEIGRLREPYRSAVVLCYLEGRTYDEAARLLGCPVGTIKSRLATARETLRSRLTRRGLAPCAGVFIHVLIAETANASVPRALSETALAGAFSLTTNGRSCAGVVSATVATLTKGVLRTMAWAQLRIVSVLSLVVIAAGVGAIAQQNAGSGGPPPVARAIDPQSRTGNNRQPPREEVLDAPTALVARPQPDRATIAVEKALKKPISLELSNEPLFDAVKLLAAKTGLNFVFDPKALSEEGVGKDSRVSLMAENISLNSALKLLLRPLGLTHKVEEDIVLITAPPGSMMIPLQYYVGDLVPKMSARAGEPAQARAGMDPLIDLIVSTVAPGTWNLQDGPGQLETSTFSTRRQRSGAIVPIGNQNLVICHTDEVHQQVRVRLRQLRRLSQALAPAPGETSPAKEVLSEGEPVEEQHAGGHSPKVKDSAPRRTVFVPLLRSDDLSRGTAFVLTDLMIKQIEMHSPHRVVGMPDDADLILDWSLRPSGPRIRPSR